MGEIQQVQNGDMKSCLHKDNSIDNCAKLVWEMPEPESFVLKNPDADGQKATPKSGLFCKENPHLKRSQWFMCMTA